ncbi:hypothetical protein [Marinicrinis sediminis]|uniref:Uncharacterized protein n=1 Tax=Marinicrinis sediminis TaxID=1652465 RepID=A0ABW5R8C4_9BACL
MTASHQDHEYEGRDRHDMDIDRMVNEGLGGGQVTFQNGLVDDSTTDTMDEGDSILNQINRSYEQPEAFTDL